MPRWMIYNGFNAWGKQRDLPPAPKKSFRELYRQRGNSNGQEGPKHKTTVGNGSKDLKG